MRLLLIVSALCSLAWIPLALLLDRLTGVEGYEMREVYPAADWAGYAADNQPATTADWLSLVYGTPVGDQPRRFVLVPRERITVTPNQLTLIRFDRTRGEELLQAQTLRNVALALCLGNALVTVALFAAERWRRRRVQARSAA